MNTKEEAKAAFERLLIIMDELREQCPWDKKQSIDTLRHLTIEEVYELSDAIIKGDYEEIKKELGDVLLHIVFYARIGTEQKQFTVDEMIHQLCEKLIQRHPHIYGSMDDGLNTVNTEQDVKENWERLKLREGSNKTVLGGVPVSLPSMIKAYRIQEKARGVGFDWERPEQVWDKVNEEISELQNEVINQSAPGRIEDEFGDVLFALINYGRYLGVNPEDALERTNQKFIKRFNYLESEAKKAGKQLSEMTLAEMDVYWNKAKELP
jgi:MazG family protein